MTILAMPRRKRFWNPLCSSGAFGLSRRGMTGGAGGGVTVLSAGTGTAMGELRGRGQGLVSNYFPSWRFSSLVLSLFIFLSI